MRLEIHKGALPSRRRREQACPSFEAMAAKYIATHEKGWRDPRASQTWRTSLAQHARKLSKLPVDAIEARDVAAALKSVWTSSPSTAIKVKGRVAAVLDYARASPQTGLKCQIRSTSRQGPLSTLEYRPARNQ
jgi:hypothetical protein